MHDNISENELSDCFSLSLFEFDKKQSIGGL